MRLRLLTALLAAAVQLSGVAAAQSVGGPRYPEVQEERRGNVTNLTITNPDLREQAQLLQSFRSAPPEETDRIVDWIRTNADRLSPPLLALLADKLFASDRTAAFEWFALAWARAEYDADRCVDATAKQGIIALWMVGRSDLALATETERGEFGRAGERVMRRADLFSGMASPWWICSHGIRAFSRAILQESDWLRPESEWAQVRKEVVDRLTHHFVEQNKPQDDPVPTLSKYSVTELQDRRPVDARWYDDETLIFSELSGRIRWYGTDLFLWHRGDRPVELFPGVAKKRWCGGGGGLGFETYRSDKQGAEESHWRLGATEKVQVTIFNAEIASVPPLMLGGRVGSSIHELSPTRISLFGCHAVTSKSLSARHQSRWTPLAKGDGYLAFDYEDERLRYGRKPVLQARYYPSPDAPAETLPIRALGLSIDFVRYFSFRGAYFIGALWGEAVPPSDAPSCVAGWWFWPKERRTEEVCVKAPDYSPKPAFYFPSREGMVSFASERNTPHGPKPGGVYLDQGGDSWKIFEGEARKIEISPDGCNIAVLGLGPSRLRIIDLCAQETTAR